MSSANLDLFETPPNPNGNVIEPVPETVPITKDRWAFERAMRLHLYNNFQLYRFISSMPQGMLLQFFITRDGDHVLHMRAFNAEQPKTLKRNEESRDWRLLPDDRKLAHAVFEVQAPHRRSFHLDILTCVRVWENPEEVCRARASWVLTPSDAAFLLN